MKRSRRLDGMGRGAVSRSGAAGACELISLDQGLTVRTWTDIDFPSIDLYEDHTLSACIYIHKSIDIHLLLYIFSYRYVHIYVIHICALHRCIYIYIYMYVTHLCT